MAVAAEKGSGHEVAASALARRTEHGFAKRRQRRKRKWGARQGGPYRAFLECAGTIGGNWPGTPGPWWRMLPLRQLLPRWSWPRQTAHLLCPKPFAAVPETKPAEELPRGERWPRIIE